MIKMIEEYYPRRADLVKHIQLKVLSINVHQFMMKKIFIFITTRLKIIRDIQDRYKDIGDNLIIVNDTTQG